MSKPPVVKDGSKPQAEFEETQELAEIIERQIGPLVSGKQREAIVAKITTLMVSEHFSGPFPHPRHIKGYEEALPGSAERILSMAEKQQEHHAEMDKSILEAEIADQKRGMWLGAGAFFLLVILAFASAIWLENEVIAGLFLGSAALGGVGLFVHGRNNKQG